MTNGSMFEQAWNTRPGNAEVWMVSQGDDSGLVVQFFEDSEEDEAATLLAGRPIFHSVEMIRIYIPGDKTTEVVQKVDERHRRRFAQQYAQYKALGDDAVPDGTPLSEWPLLKDAQRRELRSQGFHTVEQVAQVTDQTISMGGHFGDVLHKLRGHAQQFIAKAAAGEGERRLQEELAARDEQIAALQAQINQLGQIKAEELKSATPVAPAQQPSVQPVGMEQAPIAAVNAPVQSALDDIPEVEPVEPEAPKRKRGRPRKTEEG